MYPSSNVIPTRPRARPARKAATSVHRTPRSLCRVSQVELGGELLRADRYHVRVVAGVGDRVVHQDQRDVAEAELGQFQPSWFGRVVAAHVRPRAARPTCAAVRARMTASSQGDQYSA